MLRKTFSVALTTFFLAASNTEGATPDTLTWRDLVNHPERWPAVTSVKSDLQFSKSKLDKGTQVQIYSVMANQVDLIAPEGFLFGQDPREVTLLEDANAFWSTLTQEQKELNWSKIVADRTLWPTKVTLTSGARFQNVILDAGEEAQFVTVQGNDVSIAHPKLETTLLVNNTETDIFARARALAALPVEERPGIMASVLEGRTIDVEGNPKSLARAEYYIVYYAASTCPRCKIFSPKLVEHYNQNLADRDDVEVLVWSTERPKTNIQSYMKDQGMPWVTMNDQQAKIAGYAFSKPGTVTNIPAILVLDRFGNELLASRTIPSQTISSAEIALTKLHDILK